MNKKISKKILFGMGSIAMIIAPIAAVVSCGSSSTKKTVAPVTTDIDQAKVFSDNISKKVGTAPESFAHFALPKDFPKALENTHYEFNNNEMYNLTTNAKGQTIDYWTTDISNFVMIPYFDKTETTFKIKLVADKGFTLSKDFEFELKYNTELLKWNDEAVMKAKHIFSINGKNFTTLNDALKEAGVTDTTNILPSTDKKLTEEKDKGYAYYNFADFNAKLNTNVAKGNSIKYGAIVGANKEKGSFLQTDNGKSYIYFEKTAGGVALDKPGFFEAIPKVKTEVPFVVTEENFDSVIEFQANYQPEFLHVTMNFHKTDPESDVAHDHGISVRDLNRPLNIKQRLEIDGKKLIAISNWNSEGIIIPEILTDSTVVAAKSDASQPADDIY